MCEFFNPKSPNRRLKISALVFGRGKTSPLSDNTIPEPGAFVNTVIRWFMRPGLPAGLYEMVITPSELGSIGSLVYFDAVQPHEVATLLIISGVSPTFFTLKLYDTVPACSNISPKLCVTVLNWGTGYLSCAVSCKALIIKMAAKNIFLINVCFVVRQKRIF